MSWCSMPREQQIAYAHLLNRLQNGAVLRMGPFLSILLLYLFKIDIFSVYFGSLN